MTLLQLPFFSWIAAPTIEKAVEWAGARCRCGLDNADSTSPSVPRIFGGTTVNKVITKFIIDMQSDLLVKCAILSLMYSEEEISLAFKNIR